MLTGGLRLRRTVRSSRWFRQSFRRSFRRRRAALAWAVLDLVGAMSVTSIWWAPCQAVLDLVGAMSVTSCAPCVDATRRVPVRTAIAPPSQPPFDSHRRAGHTKSTALKATYAVDVLNLMVKGHAHRVSVAGVAV